MRKPAKQLWTAGFTGFSISVVLFNLAYALNSSALAAPQFVGFFVCMLLRGGVHSATKMDFALIALPINAAIYAVVIFVVSRAIWRSNSD